MTEKEKQQARIAFTKYCYDTRLNRALSQMLKQNVSICVITNCQKYSLAEYLEKGWKVDRGCRNSVSNSENFQIVDEIISSAILETDACYYALEWIDGLQESDGNYTSDSYKYVHLNHSDAFRKIFNDVWSSPFCSLITSTPDDPWSKEPLGGVVEISDGEAFLVLTRTTS